MERVFAYKIPWEDFNRNKGCSAEKISQIQCFGSPKFMQCIYIRITMEENNNTSKQDLILTETKGESLASYCYPNSVGRSASVVNENSPGKQPDRTLRPSE